MRLKHFESELCPDCGNPSYTTLDEEKQKGVDGKVCWKGYKRMGTKKKGGKTVDNCVKIKDSVEEGSNMAMMADMVEKDHEVDMARSDLYKLAKYSIKLHNMLKNISEAEGLQGWQQSKITKAADYISSVFHNLDYEMKFAESKYHAKAPTPYKNVLSEKLNNKLVEKKKNCGCGEDPCKTYGKVKESSSKDDLEYKGWLKIYKKSPDAAESHAKHKQFLARYKKEQKK